MKLIITGATGFLGTGLISAIEDSDDSIIHALTRQDRSLAKKNKQSVKFIKCDLLNINAVRDSFFTNAIVVHSAYSNVDLDTNEIMLNNLIQCCKEFNAKKLIHISTVDVYGQPNNILIDESTLCQPSSEYSRNKYLLERLIEDDEAIDFDVIILRLGLVFGENGRNLNSLIDSIKKKPVWHSYLKSILCHNRSMNLVSLSSVVDCIIFFISTEKGFKKEVFNITDDSDPDNYYGAIEKIIFSTLDKPYYLIPIFPLPDIFFRIMLLFNGNGNVNFKKKFSNQKIKIYRKSISRSLSDTVAEYVTQYDSI